MLEKIRGVQNPLTIIALFAALAEVASTVSLATVSPDVQHIFVWFVMAFPGLLVLFFFATLNWNPKVLYAPSDFRTDDTFISMLSGGRAINEEFISVSAQLEIANREIVEKAVSELGAASSQERARLEQVVSEQISLLREKIESARESAVETTFAQLRNTMATSSEVSAIQAAVQIDGETTEAIISQKNIGKRIKSLRMKNSVGLNDLSHRTGLSASFLSQLESNRVVPTLRNLARIAMVFQKDLSYFFDVEPQRKTATAGERFDGAGPRPS